MDIASAKREKRISQETEMQQRPSAGTLACRGLRRQSSLSRIIGAALLLCLLGLSTAVACECDLEVFDIRYAAAFSDVVFIGVVHQVRNIEDGDLNIVTFRILKSWKKPLPRKINLLVSPDSVNCGYRFFSYGTFLVYASGYYDKVMTTSRCSRTHLLHDDDEDVKMLRDLVQEY